MKSCKTFYAEIHLGLKNLDTDYIVHSQQIRNYIQKFCNEVGLCVSVTHTEYVYTNGCEPGLIIRLINYPRFPKRSGDILDIAFNLAGQLKILAGQKRVSIITPVRTYTIGDI